MGDIGYNSFCTLYQLYVIPVATYVAPVWDVRDYQAPQVLQSCISRSYLGVHQFAAVSAVSIEMNLPIMQRVRWSGML